MTRTISRADSFGHKAIKGFMACMLAILASLTFSCITVVKLPVVPRLEASRNAMDRLISDGKISDAVVTWSRAIVQSELPNDYLAKYGGDILSLIQKEIDGIDPASSDRKSLAYRLSLLQSQILIEQRTLEFTAPVSTPAPLAVAVPNNDKQIETLSALIRADLKDGYDQLALITAIHSGFADKIPAGLKGDLVKIAGVLNNSWALKSLGAPANINAAKNQPVDFLKAVATVWVDRGLRMENGVGLPDRVIGTAFFIEKKGYLLTNYHVIASEVDPSYEGYSRLFVRLGSKPQEKIPAKVIGWDPIIDLALLKVEIDAPAIIPLTDSAGEDPGTRVLVYGSPGGLENTVTAGIVSALARRFMPLGDIMQIDAAVNPGNSGGPLLSENGEFLGVIFAGIEQFEGVNFGVPAFWVASVLPELYRGGLARHSWLGLQVAEFKDQLRVSYVFAGSPAYQMGIREGDAILGIDGQKPDSILAVHRLLSRIDVGKVVSIEWAQSTGGILDEVSSKAPALEGLLALQDRPRLPLEAQVKVGYSPSSLLPLFGMSVEDIGPGSFGVHLRVRDVIPGTPADESNFSSGDTISILNWQYDRKNEVAFVQLSAERRKQGFLTQTMQLGNYVDLNDLI